MDEYQDQIQWFRLEVWTDSGWHMVDDFGTREEAEESAERTAPGRQTSDRQFAVRGQWRVRRMSGLPPHA